VRICLRPESSYFKTGSAGISLNSTVGAITVSPRLYFRHPGFGREFVRKAGDSGEYKYIFLTSIELLHLVQSGFEGDISELEVRRRKKDCFFCV
jgi:hypothetical protein